MEVEEKLCRTCLRGDKELFPLDVKLENELSGKKMLEYLIGFDIPDSEAFCEICEYCRTTLIASYIFKQQCLVSEEKIKFFLKYIDENDQKCLEGDFMDPLFVDAGLPVKSEESPSPPAAIPDMEPEIEPEMEPAMEPAVEPAMEPDVEPTAPPTPEITTKGKPEKPKMLHGMKVKQCRRCKIYFSTETDYYKHYTRYHRVHKRKPQLICCLCKIKFENETQYRKHRREMHREKSTTCRSCEIKFENKLLYQEHRRAVHQKPQKKRMKKTAATAANNPKKEYFCTCGKVYNLRQSLSYHLRVHRLRQESTEQSSVEKNNSPEKTQENNVVHQEVKTTPDVAEKKEYLEAAVWKVDSNGEKIIECSKCQETFQNVGIYRKHYRKFHEMQMCEDCGKLVHMCSWPTHQEKHRKKEHFCSICGNGFKLKSRLEFHMRIHTAGLNCPVCQEKFFMLDELYRHRKSHEPPKEYKCSQCSRSFKSANGLAHHITITHTLERNFACEICDRTFSAKWTLKHHILTHTMEKNFGCEVCEKAFARKSMLRLHVRTNHPGHELPPDLRVKKFRNHYKSY